MNKIFFLKNIYYLFKIHGDWGLGIGDWGLGIGPNPQSPIPNPQSPIPHPQQFRLLVYNPKINYYFSNIELYIKAF